MTINPRLASAVALAAAIPLALTACGGGSETSGSDTSQVTSLSVLDYYNNEPDKSLVQDALD